MSFSIDPSLAQGRAEEPARVRPGFLIALGAILAGGALAVSFLGYLETRNRLEDMEYALETLVFARSPEYYRVHVARADSARFANAELGGVGSFVNRNDLLTHALSLVDPDRGGLIAEFGVFRGASINHLARHTERTIHGFDSFEGLPEKWGEGFEAGKFRIDGLPRVRENVVLHKGWFDEVLPGFREAHPEPVDFLHMDADLYSSTATVLEMLGDRIRPGTVIVFDEFLGYPGWEQGEFLAFREFVARRDVEFEYIGWVPGDQQVAVRIESLGGSTE